MNVLNQNYENVGRKKNLLCSSDKKEVSFEGQNITFKQFDKRTPGKFKIECEGMLGV